MDLFNYSFTHAITSDWKIKVCHRLGFTSCSLFFDFPAISKLDILSGAELIERSYMSPPLFTLLYYFRNFDDLQCIAMKRTTAAHDRPHEQLQRSGSSSSQFIIEWSTWTWCHAIIFQLWTQNSVLAVSFRRICGSSGSNISGICGTVNEAEMSFRPFPSILIVI